LAKQDGQIYAAEVARVQASGALGEAGRLRELFDYLAARGPSSAPATQAEIADTVFGQPDTEGDDATARVYVHRLRKRLEDFYAANGDGAQGARLVLPPGTYALRLAGLEEGGDLPPAPSLLRRRWPYALALAAALVIAFFAGRMMPGDGEAAPVNAFWQPFLDSPRPKLLVLGDYYIYGEIDPVRPEEGRLIRDFRVNSALDLELMQDLYPERYGAGEDVGLNYLPFSSAYALRSIAPVLTRGGREVRIVPASSLDADMFNRYDVIYLGLFSGMGMLEDSTFDRSGFTLGESYDELIDKPTGKIYTSDEARHIASPAYYRDYGYVARFHSPGGALVAVVAGTRDTGLRGVSPLIASGHLASQLADKASGNVDFEVLYEITGQEGADLSEHLVVARPRRSAVSR